MDWLLSGPEVASVEIEEVGYYIEHLVPKEGIVLMFGKYGAYKTPLTINMAVAIANQPDCWGLNVSNTNVLYIEGDTPRSGIIRRIQKLPNLPANLDFAFVYPGIDIINPTVPEQNKQFLSTLHAIHKRKKYGVVFVDSLRSSHQLPDKDSETPPAVYRAFAQMFPGAVIFLIHHDRKSKPLDRSMQGTLAEEEIMMESFSGSQAWINHATVGLKVQKQARSDKSFVTLVQTKNQVGVEAPPFDLKVEDGIHITTLSSITDVEYRQALDLMTWDGYGELDSKIGQHFGVPERVARDFRKRFDSNAVPKRKRANGESP